jgi:hypothetical protein
MNILYKRSATASVKAEPVKELTQPEKTNSVSAVQANAPLPIRCSFEKELNVRDASDVQKIKHKSQITSSDPGRSIDRNPLSANAYFSSRHNRELVSNVTDASDLQWPKHDSQITSSDPGR